MEIGTSMEKFKYSHSKISSGWQTSPFFDALSNY